MLIYRTIMKHHYATPLQTGSTHDTHVLYMQLALLLSDLHLVLVLHGTSVPKA